MKDFFFSLWDVISVEMFAWDIFLYASSSAVCLPAVKIQVDKLLLFFIKDVKSAC